MSKEKMTMDEAYTCPRCGCQSVDVGVMEQILSDARSEEISCTKCGSTWMVYYKMYDFNTKVLNITDTSLTEDASVDAESVLADVDPDANEDTGTTVSAE